MSYFFFICIKNKYAMFIRVFKNEPIVWPNNFFTILVHNSD